MILHVKYLLWLIVVFVILFLCLENKKKDQVIYNLSSALEDEIRYATITDYKGRKLCMFELYK